MRQMEGRKGGEKTSKRQPDEEEEVREGERGVCVCVGEGG